MGRECVWSVRGARTRLWWRRRATARALPALCTRPLGLGVGMLQTAYAMPGTRARTAGHARRASQGISRTSPDQTLALVARRALTPQRRLQLAILPAHSVRQTRFHLRQARTRLPAFATQGLQGLMAGPVRRPPLCQRRQAVPPSLRRLQQHQASPPLRLR